ncbi:tyrosine-protein phosphatase non-receptor type 18 isoform X2 [Takifugu flavidus]|uniref:tyrosine-protein phosphatase non-receptor type 18 isoform X2 n=1 Tax=Takifugu flavidus TaxID=433684 RepID=UPI002544B047|nr:tyrosine-protein phosphatase non-receptor type 18 isoform X2 [Takifugu flavidus]
MELLPSLLSTLKAVDPQAVKEEYSVVCSQTLVLKSKLGLTCEVGAIQENVKKNRYKDVLPYDQSRVVLSLPVADCDSDYINASFIQGATKNRSYIASQGPLSSTVTDFWRMIWQYDVKVIVMACREVEMGKKKCQRYWTPLHQSAAFGPFTVCNEEEASPTDQMVVRTLRVTYNQDTRSVVQYHFLSWPDHDVPSEAQGILSLLELARTTQGTHTSPLLVHCSAGCGRTGVICALDYIHDLLVTKIAADFSIMKVVLELRTQRTTAVQTKDQYLFIFRAVTSMFECFLRTSGPLYSNLSELQKPKTKTTRRTSTTNRSPEPSPLSGSLPAYLSDRLPVCLLSQAAMSDTYAVVNKSKHSQPKPSANAATRSPSPSSHHYDNNLGEAALYSTIKPRAKRAAVPIHTASANEMDGERCASLGNDDFRLTSAQGAASTDSEYEVLSSSDAQASSVCSPGHLGFNCRVQKPRGPRDLPAGWRQL